MAKEEEEEGQQQQRRQEPTCRNTSFGPEHFALGLFLSHRVHVGVKLYIKSRSHFVALRPE